MAGIRKQAIISSILVYMGTLIGAVNTYFFVKNGSFTEIQYGLTRFYSDLGQNFFIFASLGVIPVLYKFFPYFADNLGKKENDLFGRSLMKSLFGFAAVLIAAVILEPLFIRKFSNRSPLALDYYFWVLPYALGMLLFSLLEGYAWALQKTIVSNFLRETGMRIFTLIFILLYYFGLISFHVFMILFSMLYLLIGLCLLIYLVKTGQLHITFRKSRVSRKYGKKMQSMQILVFGGIIITTLGQTIDGFIIASLLGLGPTGIYTLALYASNLIQIPQRSIQSIATGVLSRKWKDKELTDIARIYQRSSINLLILSLFLFGNMWLNIRDGLDVLNIQDQYAAGIPLVLIFGIIRIIDGGTGVNSQIIGTSTFWRFEFLSGVIMLALRIPLSYIFIKEFGIVGSAYSDLISLGIYNYIRFEFLRRKFKMQPFTKETVFSLILAFAAFFIAYFAGGNLGGWTAIILRSVLFSGIMIAGVFALKLTPDAFQLLELGRKKLMR